MSIFSVSDTCLLLYDQLIRLVQGSSLTTRSGLLLGLLVFSGTAFSQNCDAITLESITNPGVYNVAILRESDGLRNGPGYSGATVYYPTDATPPYANIVIVPGYLSAETTVQDWGPYLASHGIVTMTIGTNGPVFFQFPPQRRDALLDAIVTLKAENIRAGSPLNGSIATDKFAVAGWSMGGGGAQLAAASDPDIKAVMGFCPWLTPASPSDLNHAVPLLIFSGQVDPTAPPSQHADIHYAVTPATTDKLIYEIAGGNHSVANGPDGGDGDVGRIAVSWLKQFMEEEDCYCPLLLDTPATASRYTTNVECPETGLPVELLTLSAAAAGKTNVVSWTTANEVGSEGFDVQRSNNATDWRTEGFVSSRNLAAVQAYDWVDHAPLSGSSYYRLVSRDLDGATQQSPVVSVTRSNDDFDFSLWPNPAKNRFELNISGIDASSTAATVQLFTAAGRLVYEQDMRSATLEVDVSALPPGAYVVRLIRENQAITRKLLLQ
jgi:dienelactone hydrolase